MRVPEEFEKDVAFAVEELKDKVDRRLYDEQTATVNTRVCQSDKYWGMEVEIKAEHVDLNDIISTLGRVDDAGIETTTFGERYNDEPVVTVFVADLSHEDRHTAFVAEHPASN